MHASRLLSILLRLQARGRLTAAEMAEALEVSVRTIHRDIDQLSAAGIPVIADRGRAGGFKLADGFRTQLTGLTESEAETLFLAGLPGPRPSSARRSGDGAREADGRAARGSASGARRRAIPSRRGGLVSRERPSRCCR